MFHLDTFHDFSWCWEDVSDFVVS